MMRKMANNADHLPKSVKMVLAPYQGWLRNQSKAGIHRAEPSADCTTSMPKSRRSLSEKCVPLTPKSTERDHAPVESKAPSISSQPNYVPRIASAQKSEPKYRRSVSDVVAPIPSLMFVGEDEESENAPRRLNAWDLKEDKENLKSCNNALLKRKVSQYLAPK